MAEPLPSAPAPQGPSQPSAAPGILQAFVGVLTKPADFYASVRTASGLGAPLVFAVVMGLVSGVITAVFATIGLGAAAGAMGGAFGAGMGVVSILLSPIFAVIGCFVGGAIVHVISMIAGGRGTFEQSVRVAGYASAVMPIGAVLGFVPLLNVLPNLYGLYLVALGLVAIHAADRKRTFASVAVLAALVVLMSIMGWLAGRAMQQVGQDMEGRFGPGSEFQREMQKAQLEAQRAAEQMQRAAEDLRRQQEQQRQEQEEKEEK